MTLKDYVNKNCTLSNEIVEAEINGRVISTTLNKLSRMNTNPVVDVINVTEVNGIKRFITR